MPRIDAVLAIFAVLVSVATASLVRQGESGVPAGLLFLIAAGAWVVLLSRVTLRASGRAAVLVPSVTLAVTVTVLMLVLAELVLRWGVGTRATYGEQNGERVYRSIYAYDNPTWYHLYTPNSTVTLAKPEFVHTRTVDAIGLTEQNLAVAKAKDEYLVLALGDSYTEGVGAAYDESWVKVFERRVPALSDGRVVRTLNAGMSGSDLLFEYVLLRDRLTEYRPDLILVNLNNSDVTDVVTRGGMERFRGDGTTRGSGAPGWDWLYGISFITRHVVHDVLGYTWLLMPPDRLAAAQRVATTTLETTIDAMARLAAERGARLVFIVSPHEYEVKDSAYVPEFKTLVDEVTATRQVEVVDLLDIYIRTGTLTRANSRDFYWTLDYHHNARGYALMGETVAAELARRQLLPARSAPPMADAASHARATTSR